MGNSERQTQTCIFIDGATTIFTTHATNRCKSWRGKKMEAVLFYTYIIWIEQ